MPGRQKRLLSALGGMQDANDELRAELVRHKRATAKAIRRMHNQAMSPEAIRAGAAPEIREDLTDALDSFEKARHEARLAIFGFLGTIPGATTADIGRALGISRQLASRLAHEAE